jgi:predicted phage baseplate assembly protein
VPSAFRRLERAVTPEDYATLAQRHPQVQRAQATLRWTGSWRTVFLTVDRTGGRPVDAAFEAELRAHLERYRLAGHDLEIDAPHFVALELEIFVCVDPAYFRSDVTQAVRAEIRAFFDPDRFTFTQPVRLSELYATVQRTAGVAYAEVRALHPLGQRPGDALQTGELTVGRLEIVRLADDPSFPERGVLRLDADGGR